MSTKMDSRERNRRQNDKRGPAMKLEGVLGAKLSGEDLFVLPPGGKIWKVEKE